MGGYGSMNLVLKNNSMMLSGRGKFKKEVTSYAKEKTEYNLPKASPQLLRQIKRKMIEERQSKNKKIILVYALILVTSISLILYL